MSKSAKITYLEPNAMQASRAFSPAVITQGGRTVWLAGQTTTTDLDGRDISGDFSAQAHACFSLIDQTLRRLDGTLDNLVTMTVFINDPRFGDQFVKIRSEKFSPGKYPASALITVSHFARPGIMIEIQAVAVI